MEKYELEMCRERLRKIEMIQERVDLLREKLTAIQAKPIDGMPRSTGSGASGAYFEGLVSCIQELEERIEKFKRMNSDMDLRLSLECQTPDDYKVLKECYLTDQPFRTVARKLKYSERHMYRKINQAIRNCRTIGIPEECEQDD